MADIYGKVPIAFILSEPRLTELKVYAALASFDGNGTGCFPSLASIMERSGYKNRSTVCKALNELEKKGWIERNRSSGWHPTTYKMHTSPKRPVESSSSTGDIVAYQATVSPLGNSSLLGNKTVGKQATKLSPTKKQNSIPLGDNKRTIKEQLKEQLKENNTDVCAKYGASAPSLTENKIAPSTGNLSLPRGMLKDSIAARLEQVFLAKAPEQYVPIPKQRKQLGVLASAARASDDAEGWCRTVLSGYWRIVHDPGHWLRGNPFTPAALASVLDRVIAEVKQEFDQERALDAILAAEGVE